ncbi:hypothetical protein J3458_001971 [Metarhizium acridum]|uniref:uncharacterized protein n=1 Tax=Metarhizium acridum TaxID=92637 RepID=UPI001C6B6792|nr:hypothetical protein J3458_001971 [Metarhizium acridum]
MAPSSSPPSGALRGFSCVFPKRKSLNEKSVISLLDSYRADRYADVVTPASQSTPSGLRVEANVPNSILRIPQPRGRISAR